MKRSNKRSINTLAAFALACVMFVTPAQAELILTMSDGETTITTTDLDADGAVLFAGSIGDWVLNITIGVADPMLGSDTTSTLDLASLNITGMSESGGTLYISLTDTDNLVPLDDTNYLIEFGGTSDGTISFESYVDTGNTAFGDEILLYDTGSLGGAFSGGGFGYIDLDGPYSITTVVTIEHEQGFMGSGFSHGVTISEPGSLALIGIGLLGLAFGIRHARRSKRD